MNQDLLIEKVKNYLKMNNYEEEYIMEVITLLSDNIDEFPEIINDLVNDIYSAYVYENPLTAIEDICANRQDFLDKQISYYILLLLLDELWQDYNNMVTGHKLARKYLN